MPEKSKKLSNGYKLHSIGIGTWEIGGGMTSSSANDSQDIEALKYSLKKGQNHIDTAEMYGGGHSEEVVGKAIKGFERKELFIASKVWRNNATQDRIPKACENSLQRLQVEKLDLLYIHGCWEDKKIKEYIGGLNDAVELGLTKAIGLSNFNLEQLKIAVSLSKHPIIALQNRYNLSHQFEVDDELKTYCAKNGIMIVAYTPLEGAARNNKVLEIAKKYKKTPEQIAINWLISQENVITIPKSTDQTHIDENLKALDFEIDPQDMRELFKLG